MYKVCFQRFTLTNDSRLNQIDSRLQKIESTSKREVHVASSVESAFQDKIKEFDTKVKQASDTLFEYDFF